MKKAPLSNFLLFAIIAVFLPGLARANKLHRLKIHTSSIAEVAADTVFKSAPGPLLQDEKQQEDKNQKAKKQSEGQTNEKGQEEKKQEGETVGIKQVPTAKRQEMPLPVTSRIKVPIKIISPITRKPIRIIRRNLGL